MKILFFASYPTCGNGYGRIGNIISNYLASVGHQVYYLGISNFKESPVERYIHPSIQLIDALEKRKSESNELYGVDIICEMIQEATPDLVFIYNDIIVVNRILNEFINTKLEKTFKMVTYLDVVYNYEKLYLFKNINAWSDLIFVFSEHWKKHLTEIGISEKKLFILPHGVDKTIFKQINKDSAKQKFGFKSDDFIVLNTNRNCYRKATDITIDAFVKFIKKQKYNDNIKLFLNLLNTSTSGYNILDMIQISCLKNKADYEQIIFKHIFTRNSLEYLSDEKLNELYNACDIGINTCIGEGFGLCNLEHASIGNPQIISNVGAFKDIFHEEYSIPIEPKVELYVPNSTEEHGGFLQICDSGDFSDAMDMYFKDTNLRKLHGDVGTSILSEKYNWEIILNGLNKTLLQLYI
jgi:glycosyltransferase involved in cell wall biosynthesis